MSYTIKGTVDTVGPVEQVTDRFRKREIIIETEGKYPQFVSLEAAQDKCELLDGITPGTTVELSFDVRGRKYTSRKTGKPASFTSLSVWSVKTEGEPKPTPSTANEDDLPF